MSPVNFATLVFFLRCQRRDLGAQAAVLGLEDRQLLLGAFRLESPLLTALGEIGHAVPELLERDLEFLVLVLPTVAAFSEEPDQRAGRLVWFLVACS